VAYRRTWNQTSAAVAGRLEGLAVTGTMFRLECASTFI